MNARFDPSIPQCAQHAMSRRRLLRAGLGGAVLLPQAATRRAVARTALADTVPSYTEKAFLSDQPNPISPGTWRTWLLAKPSELRPPAPLEPTRAEIDELLDLQAKRTFDSLALVRTWASRPAVVPWTEIANDAFAEFKLPPVRQSRAQGLLQTAMYDTVVAAYNAQDAYSAAVPSAVNRQVTAVEGIHAERPAFPSADAAVAGAAAKVLTALLPDASPGRFIALAEEAAMAQLQAGVNFRRDVAAGLALGTAIGERALAHGADDRPGSDWDGSGRLEGDGYWVPTPPAYLETPLEPLAATWKLWVMTSSDQFRPAPPPAYPSPAWESQLAAVQEAVAQRSFAQARTANYWQGSSASKLWDGIAADLIARDALDLPHAARVLALLAVAMADAQIACWDGKYTYWTERPITADPALDVLFPTPPFPSYPSAHATVSNAAAIVLAHLFPDDAADLLDLAEEAAASRGWAGIHYPIDDDAGTSLGRQVGYLVAAVARGDGAE